MYLKRFSIEILKKIDEKNFDGMRLRSIFDLVTPWAVYAHCFFFPSSFSSHFVEIKFDVKPAGQKHRWLISSFFGKYQCRINQSNHFLLNFVKVSLYVSTRTCCQLI